MMLIRHPRCCWDH